jgi:glycosyltransferase involved in cell wall biosynthesis
MKILFITPYYPPEVGAPQARIHEMGLRLQAMGHDVTVLTTFPNYPSGVVPEEWRGHFLWRGTDQNVKIVRVWTWAVPNSGFYKRLMSQLSFVLFSSLAGVFLPRADMMIVESPPLFNGIGGMFLGLVKRAPYVFNVADLWPESAVQLGMLSNPTLIRMAKWLERLIYRRAAKVIAVTPGTRDTIVRDGIDSDKVAVIRNAVDTRFFSSAVDGHAMRTRMGIGRDKFMVLYAGTMGISQQLSSVLEAAAIFQREGDPKVHFVFAGDGAEREMLVSKMREMKLANVTFLPPFPKDRMPEVLNAADSIIVSLRAVELFKTVLPTKLFEAMSCEKPVVLAGQGEVADLVREAEAGVCVTPGDAQEIHDGILTVVRDPLRAARMGQSGRKYVQMHFSRDKRAHELNELLAPWEPRTNLQQREAPVGRSNVA